MRIAQLANFVGPVSGGMRVALDTLGRGYVASGHERVLVIPGERDEVTEGDDGVVVRLKAPKVSSTYRMIVHPRRALEALERFNPTTIEVSDKWTLTPAASWARRRGVGSVLFSHERLTDMLAMWLKRQFGVEAAVGALNRRLARSFDLIVVTSQFAADEFAGLPASVELVPLGVDLDTFHPSVGRPVDDGVVKLCHVGRMSREKSPQLAVAAAVELHRRGVPVRLDMYGVGPDMAMLRRVAGDAPVHFSGFVAGRDEVAARFAAADISMSVCPAETFGLAVLEALACGTPVVSSDRGGASEIVDETCGAHARPDPEAIADATQRLIWRMGPKTREAARRRAETYTWDRTVSRMLALHVRLADRTSGG